MKNKIFVAFSILGASTAVLVLTAFLALQPIEIRQILTDAMEPTLNKYDCVVVAKYIVNAKSLRRGEVIEYKDDLENRFVIRRVLAVSSDLVVVDKDRILLVNDESRGKILNSDQCFTGKLKDGVCLVKADNQSSKDSNSALQLIQTPQIIGKVLLKTAPSLERVN